MGSLPQLWDTILTQLDPPSRALLATCQAESIDDQLLHVVVPNDFTRERIEQRLHSRIAEVASLQTGFDLKLKVSVDPTIYQPPVISTPLTNPLSTPIAPWPVAANLVSPRPVDSPLLNRKYTFDTFVIGQSNRFAHAAAVAVAEGAVEQGPGKAYNPLLIYGDSGLGKTHLLHAIGNYIIAHSEHLRVKYVSTEELTNDFINAISENRMTEFRRNYREVDVLLIDDIQFLESKIGTQEEFFHTFNTLHNAQKQIVMTSDRPPKLLEALEPRLRSRFEWGLLVDITPADLETRIAILQKKAQAENLSVAPDVMELIASKIQTNIRELEGALIRLTAFASLSQTQPDCHMASIVLKDLIADGIERPISINMVIVETADHFELSIDELRGPGRAANIALARQIAMYLSRDLTDLSLPKIGQEFDRDHTTVMHAYRKIRDLITKDRTVFTNVTDITNKVHQRAQRA
ncbi:MAG: chromosomal replication initiator protein DnaA [Propionibacteriaceae bacterium]|nr:chromosomal replication initiator protein DnaA [Propionibacteriaceae bacterium]